MNKAVFTLLCAFTIFSCEMSSVAQAQDEATWDGSVSGIWNVSGNWDNNQVPGGSFDAFVDTASTVTVNAMNLQVGSLDFRGGGILELNQDFTITGGGENIGLGGTASPLVVTGAGSEVKIASGATLTVQGSISVDGGTISGGSLETTANPGNGSAPTNIVVQNSGAIDVDSVNVVGDYDHNAGSLVVDDFTVSGDYNFSGGTLTMELGGATDGADTSLHGYLDIGGDFDVSNSNTTLDVVNVNGFLASEGDSFNLWDVGVAGNSAVSGTFADINLPELAHSNFYWDDSSLLSTGELTVLAVPEPSSLAVLGILVTVCSAGRRRRSLKKGSQPR